MCPRPISLEKRRSLALAAFEVVRERGAHNVTMSDLASALGMKRPTLYWYFRDLGHVFDIVFEHVLEKQRALVAEHITAVSHPIDQVMAYADAIEAYFQQEGATMISLVTFWGATESDRSTRASANPSESREPPGKPSELGSRDSGPAAGSPQVGRVIELAMKSFGPVRAAGIERLKQGIREGTVAPCDPAGIVDLVAVTLDGYLLHRILRGLRWEDVRAVLWERVLAPLKRG